MKKHLLTSTTSTKKRKKKVNNLPTDLPNPLQNDKHPCNNLIINAYSSPTRGSYFATHKKLIISNLRERVRHKTTRFFVQKAKRVQKMRKMNENELN